MVPFTEMRITGKSAGWGGVLQTQEFNFGYLRLEEAVQHPNGDIK